MSQQSTFAEIADALKNHQSFLMLSHVRPDGDAIGSELAMGGVLEEMGKTVYYVNEDGLPTNLEFLAGSEKIQLPPAEPLDIEVVVALDCATKPRLGEKSLAAAAKAKLWINIDHHISNPAYGDLNLIDATSPATGQILYNLIKDQDLPLPAVTRDNIYVAVSTDTGSFQYGSTTAATYRMAADMVDQGLQVGEINALTYDNHPYRRVELLRSLLNTLELCAQNKVAHWELTREVKEQLELLPEDSEGLIDMIRAIQGVEVAIFFEELMDGQIRVSMRSKNKNIDVCQVAQQFGGGGHKMAAGIRMPGPMSDAKPQVLAAIEAKV